MEKQNIEEMYDLSVITRDNLRFLLNEAINEFESLENAKSKVDSLEKEIASEKRYTKRRKREGLTIVAIIFLFLFFLLLWIKPEGVRLEGVFIKGEALSAIFISVSVISATIRILLLFSDKRRKSLAITNLQRYDEYLQKLQNENKKLQENIHAIFLIPDEYCYEYAFATMLKYIDNKRADSWKEVTGLYEEHLHRMTVEENTRVAAEQATMQAEYARQTRNASRMAAAGAWASAAGIWRISSKL